MGNGETKSAQNAQSEELPKITHQRFANREILKIGNDQEIIQIKISVPHQKEYTLWSDQLTKLGPQDFLLLPKSHHFTKEGFCGLSGVVEITYENYPFLLSDQIHNRQCLGAKFFEESELWYLVLTLLSAADYFHTKGKKVGDIRPSNVFISEDGSVKTACYLSWPMERTNYEKSFEKQTTYISPEQMNELAFGKLDPSSSLSLSQTFSIGLTLLDAATLSDSQDMYKSQKNLDYGTLQSRLKELNEKEDYSKLLRGIIHNMCEINHQNRISSQQLYHWLIPYQEQINNFQQFEPNDIPDKLKSVLRKASPPKISNNSFSVNKGPPTYIGNTYLHHSNPYNAPPLSPSKTVKIQYNTYIPPSSPKKASEGSIVPGPDRGVGATVAKISGTSSGVSGVGVIKIPGTGSGVGVIKVPAAGSGVGVTYHSGSSAQGPLTYTNSPLVVNNPRGSANFVPNTSSGATFNSGFSNLNAGVVESTYVPFNSKISLNKIDEQLQQSRKLFPS